DGNDRLRYSVDPLGQVTEQRYDAAGNVTDTIRYAKPISGNLVSSPSAVNGDWYQAARAATAAEAGFPGSGSAVQIYDRDSYASGVIAVQPGETYRFEMDTIRGGTDDGRTPVPFSIGFQYSGAAMSWATATYSDPGQAGVQHVTGTLTVPPGVTGARIWLLISANTGQTNRWYARNVEVRKLGDNAVQPLPAQLDEAAVRQRLLTSAADQVTHTTYDAAGRPTFSIDAQGYVTERRYDAAGNVTDTIRYAKSISGNLVSSPSAVNGDWYQAARAATAAEAGFPGSGSAVQIYDRDSYASGVIAVQPGETYRFEMDTIRGGTDDGRTPVPFSIGFQYSGAAMSWATATYSDPGQAGVQHVTGTLTVPPGVTGARIWLLISANTGQTNRWYARNVEVRKLGDNAANPLPAQLDEAAVRQRLLTSAADQITHTTYDAAGRPTFSIDAQGYVTERKYDAAGNVTDTVRYAKPIIGNLVGSPNAVNGDWLFPYSVATVPASQAGFKTGGSAILQSDRDSYASGMIAVKAGETYSFEMDVIRGGTDDGRTPAPFGIGFQYSTDGVNYADSWVAATYSDASQTGAQHLQARLTIPDRIKGARIWLQINAKNTQTNRWYARNVEVRKLGDNAVQPLPAQLDEAAVRQRLLTSAADQVTHTTYDAAGRPTFSIDAQGYVTERKYDAAGNVTDTIRYAKPISGNLVGSPNAVNSDWLYPYSVATVPAAQAGFQTGGNAILQSDRDSYASGLIAVKEGDTFSFDLDALRGGTGDGKTPAEFAIGFRYSADGVTFLDSWDRVAVSDASQAGLQHLHNTRVIPPGVKGAQVWLQINAPWGQTNRWYARNVEVRKLGDNAVQPLPAQLDEAAIRQRLLTSAQDQTSHNDYDNAGRLTAVSKNGAQTVRYELDAYGNRIKEW
ncbi:hypothetical protein, partial [Chromobacterium violaceum]